MRADPARLTREKQHSMMDASPQSKAPTHPDADAPPSKPNALVALVQAALGSPAFAPAGPLRAHMNLGDAASRAVLIVGANATGKSFVMQELRAACGRLTPRAEVLGISMRARTSEGMHRAFMFGPRGDKDSTGSVSTVALRGGLRTAGTRSTPCLLQLDEPDLGLAEEYAFAMGQWIAAEDPTGTNAACLGMALVTHSRELVRGFFGGCAARPHFLQMGDRSSASVDDWLEAPIQRRTLEDLQGLSASASNNYRTILSLAPVAPPRSW